MAEHREACEAGEASSYCMNGGTCYRIPSVSTLTCVCSDGFKGSRCEEFQLFSSSQNKEKEGLIAAMALIIFFIIVLLIIIIYYACRMWRKSHENNSRTAEHGRMKTIP